MSSAVLQVEIDDFVDGAREMTGAVATPVAHVVATLTGTLGGCGAMAGTDPGGLSWASSYDQAARSATAAGAHAANAGYRIAELFVQSARNYAAAEAASTAHGSRSVSLPPLPQIGHVTAGYLPSAAGGTTNLPGGWSLVDGLIGVVWPNGHQDVLRRAASAWNSAGDALADRSSFASLPAAVFGRDALPEGNDIGVVCQGLNDRLNELGGIYGEIGAACEALADHLDQVHGGVRSALLELGWQTGAIEAVGFVASLFTGGTAQAPTQATEASRLAAIAARITELIESFTAAVHALGALVMAKIVRLDELGAELYGLCAVRLSVVTVDWVKGLPRIIAIRERLALSRLMLSVRDLPALTTTPYSLQRQYDHAAILGITANYNKVNSKLYGEALERFMSEPDTIRVPGKFFKDPAILNYNADSGVVVIQHPDGSLWSMWRLDKDSDQYRNLRVRRSLGGKHG